MAVVGAAPKNVFRPTEKFLGAERLTGPWKRECDHPPVGG